MKIILSRKGFDSSYGGAASPILPDGRMVSLPIPERPAAVTPASRTYRQIRTGNVSAGALVQSLTRGAVAPHHAAHPDPDLDAGSVRPRPPGWRPAFGQTGAAASHLRNQGVGPGDVFLYFGWFQEVIEPNPGVFRWKVDADDIHACFGFLQVAERLSAAPPRPRWRNGWRDIRITNPFPTVPWMTFTLPRNGSVCPVTRSTGPAVVCWDGTGRNTGSPPLAARAASGNCRRGSTPCRRCR